jgi:hypothetical protein
MKYRYLKISGDKVFWGTNVLSREELIRLKDGFYESIIDLLEMTYFDVDTNQWVAIEGDA